MPRINTVNVDKVSSETKQIYQNLEKKLGRVPNIFLNMGNSPTVLKGFFGLSEAANQTSLSRELREEIALLTAQINGTKYCLSAHTANAKECGLSDQDIAKARHGEAHDPKTQAILKFVKTLIEKRGQVTNQDVASLKAAGINDTQLVEVILVTILNIFTNYFNNVTDPQVDFPLAPELN